MSFRRASIVPSSHVATFGRVSKMTALGMYRMTTMSLMCMMLLQSDGGPFCSALTAPSSIAAITRSRSVQSPLVPLFATANAVDNDNPAMEDSPSTHQQQQQRHQQALLDTLDLDHLRNQLDLSTAARTLAETALARSEREHRATRTRLADTRARHVTELAHALAELDRQDRHHQAVLDQATKDRHALLQSHRDDVRLVQSIADADRDATLAVHALTVADLEADLVTTRTALAETEAALRDRRDRVAVLEKRQRSVRIMVGTSVGLVKERVGRFVRRQGQRIGTIATGTRGRGRSGAVNGSSDGRAMAHSTTGHTVSVRSSAPTARDPVRVGERLR